MRLLAVVTGAVSLLIVPAAGQAPKPEAAKKAATWTPARRPDGQPDVQGFWVTAVYGMGLLEQPDKRARLRRVVSRPPAAAESGEQGRRHA